LSKRIQNNRKNEGEESNSFKTPVMKRLKLSNLTPGKSPAFEIPPSPSLKQLGFGTGVKVLLYERSPRSGGLPRSPWAIKKLSKAHATLDIAQRLDEEAKILKSLKHPNIIGYRGFKRSVDGTRILALETGKECLSLFDMVEKIRDEGTEDKIKPFEAKKILKTIKEVAKALDYLHTEKRILHGDLKGANVLVIGDFDAIKLCDFGVTLPLNENGVADFTRQYVGTQPWSAKEVIEEETITTKTDIFALGCVIFEMLSLDTPHADKLPDLDLSVEEDENASYDTSEYDEAMGTRPELPDYLDIEGDEDYDEVLGIFYACTMEDPNKRPSARKLVEILEENEENNKVVSSFGDQ